MTTATIIQSLTSGLLMGLLYGLVAVGIALIFGLMDVTNFAHGEFLMIAMYATFFLFAFFALDPLLSAPLVAAALFIFGAVVYLLIVRFAVRAKANTGMVQIFSTFGLAIVMRDSDARDFEEVRLPFIQLVGCGSDVEQQDLRVPVDQPATGDHADPVLI